MWLTSLLTGPPRVAGAPRRPPLSLLLSSQVSRLRALWSRTRPQWLTTLLRALLALVRSLLRYRPVAFVYNTNVALFRVVFDVARCAARWTVYLFDPAAVTTLALKHYVLLCALYAVLIVWRLCFQASAARLRSAITLWLSPPAVRARAHALQRELEAAESYAQWRRAAEGLDALDARSAEWKSQAASSLYDFRRISMHLLRLRELYDARDTQGLMWFLRASLVRNIVGINHKHLYSRLRAGTKTLIEDYISEVVRALQLVCVTPSPALSLQDKLAFFNETRHAYGRSALLLSGGATLGLYHTGVVRALAENQLLPRVIAGSSVGSIICAIVGTRTEPELLDLLSGRAGALNLSFFPSNESSVSRKVRRLLYEGRLMDIDILSRAVQSNVPNLTFQEAFDRTGRIVNIVVSPAASAGNRERFRILNYLTAPNVLIWSAALASCAIPLVYQSVELLAKDDQGNTVPYLSNESVKWEDGSFSLDLPMARLSELFNVNHFIVSQVNPHIVPFLTFLPDIDAGHAAGTGAAARSAGGVRSAPWDFLCNPVSRLLRFLGQSLSQLVLSLGDLGLVPVHSYVGALLNQSYTGDITILPSQITHRDYLTLLHNPTPESLDRQMRASQRDCWAMLPRIEAACAIEFTLEECVARLRGVQLMEAFQKRTRLINNANAMNAASAAAIPLGSSFVGAHVDAMGSRERLMLQQQQQQHSRSASRLHQHAHSQSLSRPQFAHSQSLSQSDLPPEQKYAQYAVPLQSQVRPLQQQQRQSLPGSVPQQQQQQHKGPFSALAPTVTVSATGRGSQSGATVNTTGSWSGTMGSAVGATGAPIRRASASLLSLKLERERSRRSDPPRSAQQQQEQQRTHQQAHRTNTGSAVTTVQLHSEFPSGTGGLRLSTTTTAAPVGGVDVTNNSSSNSSRATHSVVAGGASANMCRVRSYAADMLSFGPLCMPEPQSEYYQPQSAAQPSQAVATTTAMRVNSDDKRRSSSTATAAAVNAGVVAATGDRDSEGDLCDVAGDDAEEETVSVSFTGGSPLGDQLFVDDYYAANNASNGEPLIGTAAGGSKASSGARQDVCGESSSVPPGVTDINALPAANKDAASAAGAGGGAGADAAGAYLSPGAQSQLQSPPASAAALAAAIQSGANAPDDDAGFGISLVPLSPPHSQSQSHTQSHPLSLLSPSVLSPSLSSDPRRPYRASLAAQDALAVMDLVDDVIGANNAVVNAPLVDGTAHLRHFADDDEATVQSQFDSTYGRFPGQEQQSQQLEPLRPQIIGNANSIYMGSRSSRSSFGYDQSQSHAHVAAVPTASDALGHPTAQGRRLSIGLTVSPSHMFALDGGVAPASSSAEVSDHMHTTAETHDGDDGAVNAAAPLPNPTVIMPSALVATTSAASAPVAPTTTAAGPAVTTLVAPASAPLPVPASSVSAPAVTAVSVATGSSAFESTPQRPISRKLSRQQLAFLTNTPYQQYPQAQLQSQSPVPVLGPSLSSVSHSSSAYGHPALSLGLPAAVSLSPQSGTVSLTSAPAPAAAPGSASAPATGLITAAAPVPGTAASAFAPISGAPALSALTGASTLVGAGGAGVLAEDRGDCSVLEQLWAIAPVVNDRGELEVEQSPGPSRGQSPGYEYAHSHGHSHNQGYDYSQSQNGSNNNSYGDGYDDHTGDGEDYNSPVGVDAHKDGGEDEGVALCSGPASRSQSRSRSRSRTRARSGSDADEEDGSESDSNLNSSKTRAKAKTQSPTHPPYTTGNTGFIDLDADDTATGFVMMQPSALAAKPAAPAPATPHPTTAPLSAASVAGAGAHAVGHTRPRSHTDAEVTGSSTGIDADTDTGAAGAAATQRKRSGAGVVAGDNELDHDADGDAAVYASDSYDSNDNDGAGSVSSGTQNNNISAASVPKHATTHGHARGHGQGSARRGRHRSSSGSVAHSHGHSHSGSYRGSLDSAAASAVAALPQSPSQPYGSVAHSQQPPAPGTPAPAQPQLPLPLSLPRFRATMPRQLSSVQLASVLAQPPLSQSHSQSIPLTKSLAQSLSLAPSQQGRASPALGSLNASAAAVSPQQLQQQQQQRSRSPALVLSPSQSYGYAQTYLQQQRPGGQQSYEVAKSLSMSPLQAHQTQRLSHSKSQTMLPAAPDFSDAAMETAAVSSASFVAAAPTVTLVCGHHGSLSLEGGQPEQLSQAQAQPQLNQAQLQSQPPVQQPNRGMVRASASARALYGLLSGDTGPGVTSSSGATTSNEAAMAQNVTESVSGQVSPSDDDAYRAYRSE